MISEKDIENFLKCKNILDRGKLHIESGHIKKFHHENGLIKAIKAYYVEVEVQKGKVVAASCDCAVGSVGSVGLATCSHMAAVLLHYRHNVSCTDVPCVCKAPEASEEGEVKSMKSLFPLPPNMQVNIQPFDAKALRSLAYRLLSELPEPTGMLWILSPEPEVDLEVVPAENSSS